MSTHNICFHGEIRKIFTGYPPPLSRPMCMCGNKVEYDMWFFVSTYQPKEQKGTGQ